MSASDDVGALTEDLGQQWKISENCYKVWACCGHTHSAIDVIVDLRARSVDDSAASTRRGVGRHRDVRAGI